MADAPTDRTEKSPSHDGVDSQLGLVSTFLSENEVLIERLRHVQIPQHVGMAAAGLALAADLPRVLMAQTQADLSSGALGKRWHDLLKRLSADAGEEPERLLAAVATLLIELAQRAGRYVAVRGEEWSSDAYRLEGQASAIEAQVHRFQRAREGISRSRMEGQAAAARQAERREERDAGIGPGHGEENDGHDA